LGLRSRYAPLGTLSKALFRRIHLLLKLFTKPQEMGMILPERLSVELQSVLKTFYPNLAGHISEHGGEGARDIQSPMPSNRNTAKTDQHSTQINGEQLMCLDN
jgi:hypothetical protein